MKKLKIKSYCKINLNLRVIKKLKNGFHSIISLVTFCHLHDVISLQKIKGLNDKIIFSGQFSKGINQKNNTISKVLHLLRKRNFLLKQSFKISVKKNIPHGSGLGSGSANAADLIKFFNLKMNLKLKKNHILKIAKKVGFDVPTSLERKNTIITGKGDKTLRLNKKFKLNILIIYPNIICSTKKIYKKNKKFSFKKFQPNLVVKNKEKLIRYLMNESNDLEQTVFKHYPKVKKIIGIIKDQKGCYFSRITGSGSACIGIFNNMKAAIYAKKLIKLKYPKYWCVVSKTI